MTGCTEHRNQRLYHQQKSEAVPSIGITSYAINNKNLGLCHQQNHKLYHQQLSEVMPAGIRYCTIHRNHSYLSRDAVLLLRSALSSNSSAPVVAPRLRAILSKPVTMLPQTALPP